MSKLSKKLIEQRRTPAQFDRWIEEVWTAVRSDTKELQLAKAGEGFYKVFVDELVPLAAFCKSRFDDTHEILPALGNQPFDATVFKLPEGPDIHVEITVPRDGCGEANETKLVANRGFGTVRWFVPGEEATNLTEFVKTTAKSKSEKDYSDCILVFVLRTAPQFDQILDAHQEEENKLVELIANFQFKAMEVWVLGANSRIIQVMLKRVLPA